MAFYQQPQLGTDHGYSIAIVFRHIAVTSIKPYGNGSHGFLGSGENAVVCCTTACVTLAAMYERVELLLFKDIFDGHVQ